MVSLETVQTTSTLPLDPISSPRISFSVEFLNESNFISICPNPQAESTEREIRNAHNTADFEFLSEDSKSKNIMDADELFSEGKLLPFWQIHQSEKLSKISLKPEIPELEPKKTEQKFDTNEPRIWFIDDDPSPRPPNCTVLFKELLRLKKQRASALSPSSSSSSSSRNSVSENVSTDEKKDVISVKDKAVKRIKKGLERTRSASIRIRPVINLPICTQGKSSVATNPLFSLRRSGGRVDR